MDKNLKKQESVTDIIMGKNENQDAFNEVKREYMDIKAPERGLLEMQKRIEEAKRDKRALKRQKSVRYWGTAVAAVLVLFILLNTNHNIAHAMGNIPVLGGFFKVITIRENYYEEDARMMSARVPEIQASSGRKQDAASTEPEKTVPEGQDISPMCINETQEAIKALNGEITEYVDMLLNEFEADMEKEGFRSLEIDYTTITDTENWFTLEICAVETAASGYEFRKYYHMDKVSGEVVTLKDLLQDDEKSMQAVSEEIKHQMQERIEKDSAIYFLKSAGEPNGFESITETQNFYINSDGQLVIVFNEYDVAPGSAGCPEFVIPDEVWKTE